MPQDGTARVLGGTARAPRRAVPRAGGTAHAPRWAGPRATRDGRASRASRASHASRAGLPGDGRKLVAAQLSLHLWDGADNPQFKYEEDSTWGVNDRECPPETEKTRACPRPHRAQA